MTKEKMFEKVKELNELLSVRLEAEIERLYDSGGIDPEKYEDNYLLPKILLHVALTKEAECFQPLSKEGKADAKNLYHF